MEYHFTPGTVALAPLIVLHEIDVAYIPRRVDFASAAQRSDGYRAINPKGRVPTLVVDGEVLTETPAILAYLAQTHPGARLIPDDAMGFAQVQSVNAYLCATVHVAHAHRMRGARWVDGEDHEAAMRAKVPQTMTACFAHIEKHMLRGPWVMGERYSIADPYLYTIAGWLKGDGVDIAEFPGVAAHVATMEERAAVQAANAVMAEPG